MHTQTKLTITVAALLTGAVAFFAVSSNAAAPRTAVPGKSLTSHITVLPAELKWAPGPPNLPKGIQAAMMDGDPKVPDRLFTLRLKLPANTRIAPHHHSTDEHVTVLSGEFQIAMGEKFDEKALKTIPAGGFTAMPAGHNHYAMARTETTLQLHGVGPWTITYVNPSDDPSRGVGGAGPTP